MGDILLFATAVVLLFLSGAFSGLNIGMMMARPEDIQRKARQGDAVAARVYKYRKDGYYLIFCILLGNVGVNTAMSILLGNVTSGIIGGLLATALITTFGEILPQAIFTQRGYRFVRHFFWLLEAVYVAFWPLANPVSRLLSRWIGAEPVSLYSHVELQQIIHEHATNGASSVDYDESRIASGALQFSQKTAADVATPIVNVEAVKLKDTLDAATVQRLKIKGHSRIPVQSNGQFVGLLYMKDLVGRALPVRVSQVYRDKIYDVYAGSRLDTVLSRFIQTHNHLFAVVDENDKEVGIITLEDVMEEIIRREIEDEFDGNFK